MSSKGRFAVLENNTFKLFVASYKAVLGVETMRMRTVKLTPKFLTEALQGKAASFASNLPTDIELLDLKFDLFSNQVCAIIRSESFEDIAEAYPIPELNIIYTAKPKTEPQLTTVKNEGKPTTNIRPELRPNPKPQTHPNQYTSKIEEEFNPEQRKLLSFKIEADCVIVKPTQFLKAEWEDINEVVRSLGGKWVKGDIISYWQIPLQ
jgi:hypothetical protein